MSITPIAATAVSLPKKISIIRKENPDQLLFNKVLKIVRGCKAPATFRNEIIELPAPTQPVVDSLKTQGIVFNEIA